ncbi:hypothetical protein Pcinc_028854 [Petrolisthes cinctipes]|uniref:Uncharacterized protein n=1 Tax=Petrolisthes cinctipes TaxID=88211 RepID=A0AAE1F168_PETCI|nr:hypothetical protein Pcinc_028854 [Petrolisthes cinctipes]
MEESVEASTAPPIRHYPPQVPPLPPPSVHLNPTVLQCVECEHTMFEGTGSTVKTEGFRKTRSRHSKPGLCCNAASVIHNLPLPLLESWHNCDWAPTPRVGLLALFTSLICFCRSSGFQLIDAGGLLTASASCN